MGPNSGEATTETGVEGVAVEVSTDEDDLGAGLLAGVPRPIGLAFEEHVDALEDESVLGALEAKDALHAEDVLALGLEQFGQPGVELLGIKLPFFLDADATHGFVVVMVVGMAPVFMEVNGCDGLTVLDEGAVELGESVLGEQRVIAVGGDADAILAGDGAEDEFLEGRSDADAATGTHGHRDLFEGVGGDLFGGVQGIMGGAALVTVVMTALLVVVLVGVAMIVIVIVTTGSVAFPVVVSVSVRVAMGFMGVELQEDNAHDGVGAGFEAEGMIACVKVVGTGPFEGERLIEEAGFEGQLMVEIEGVDVEDLIDVEIALGGAMELGDAVDRAQSGFEMIEFGGGDEVGLVEEDAVGEGDLFLGLV